MSSRSRRGGGASSGARRVVVSSSTPSLNDRFSQIKPKTYQTSVNARQTATANNRFSAVMAARTGRAPTSAPRPARGASIGGRGGRGRGGRGSIVRTGGGLRTSGSLQSGGFRSSRGGRAATVSAAASGGRGRGRGGRGRGSGGRGRGRGGKGQGQPPSKEDLDNDLDSYMQSSRSFLDDDLVQYQAEREK